MRSNTGKNQQSDMTMATPLITIITVVFNGGLAFQKTLQSVMHLKQNETEYIVIDGGSTDGTVALLKQYDDQIDFWQSERDSGIYDALNKGCQKARGSFLYILNAGDALIYLPVTELIAARQHAADVVLFDVRLSDGRIFKSMMDFRTRFSSTVHHQGVFYANNLKTVYDTRYKVYADFDLNQRLYHDGIKRCSFRIIVATHSLDGISNDKSHRWEYFAVIRRNFGTTAMLLGYVYFYLMQLKIWLAGIFNAQR